MSFRTLRSRCRIRENSVGSRLCFPGIAHRARAQITSFSLRSVLNRQPPPNRIHLEPQVPTWSRSEDPREDFHVVVPHFNIGSHCSPPVPPCPTLPNGRSYVSSWVWAADLSLLFFYCVYLHVIAAHMSIRFITPFPRLHHPLGPKCRLVFPAHLPSAHPRGGLPADREPVKLLT